MTAPVLLGNYREALADVECDALIADPPYGKRTHAGHDAGVEHSGADNARRNQLSYSYWRPRDVREFVDFWSPRTRGWLCVFSCSDLAPVYRLALEKAGRATFAPIPCVIRGMSVRLSGDGPSNWTVWLNVARPRTREAARWGTLPGSYPTTRDPGYIGSKPLELMMAIVRDYSRRGDMVCDPCAGSGTTLLAALQLGRRAIGSEVDPAAHAAACARLGGPLQFDLFEGTRPATAGGERPASMQTHSTEKATTCA